MAYNPFYAGGWKDYPNTSTPITSAALNHMEAGIAAAGEGTGASYVGNQGNPQTGSYYFEIYKHIVADASSLISHFNLTDPYYYYTLEGWIKMVGKSAEGFEIYSDDVVINPFESVTGTDWYDAARNPSGKWTAYPEILIPGTAGKTFYTPSYPDARSQLSRPWATLFTSGIINDDLYLHSGISVVPITSDSMKFTNADINHAAIYFKIKIDQVRKE